MEKRYIAIIQTDKTEVKEFEFFEEYVNELKNAEIEMAALIDLWSKEVYLHDSRKSTLSMKN